MSNFKKVNNQAIHKGTADIIRVGKWTSDIASINKRITIDGDVDDETKVYVDTAWKFMNTVMALANEICSYILMVLKYDTEIINATREASWKVLSAIL